MGNKVIDVLINDINTLTNKNYTYSHNAAYGGYRLEYADGCAVISNVRVSYSVFQIELYAFLEGIKSTCYCK